MKQEEIMDASRGDNAEDAGGGRMHEEDNAARTPSNNFAYPNIMETESAGIDAAIEGSNMEAYSTPRPPLQGTKFDTLESARDHYNIYACRTGFAIRQQFKKERVDGTISRVLLEEQDFLRVLHGCNIETARQMQLMSWFYGSAKDVPYTTQDIANQRAKFRLEHRHTDVGSTIAYFQEMRAKDSYFYWRIKLDDEDRVENLFWIDHHAGHMQIWVWLRSKQTKENFVWLFNTFLHAMGGVAPKTIITDQDFAMRSAIDKRWAMMDEYGQSDNEHFHWLWENRKCWAPVYYMKHFFPFLQTAARSEGFNDVLKEYVNPNNSLFEFATQYTAIQEKVMVAVTKEQVDAIYKEADMYSLNPIELQM
ncbi:protein FAR-RED IMPAIRED RESPONSE 1-like [Aegilops tauschii subsp. strangulata]|uniref:protein FAR-RED IMPAIRED RESPONSE 1-like n=1 Tax=Aegilops tauschii subsp. strangulata TaxID=200361 RepID=UPI003CC8B372